MKAKLDVHMHTPVIRIKGRGLHISYQRGVVAFGIC